MRDEYTGLVLLAASRHALPRYGVPQRICFGTHRWHMPTVSLWLRPAGLLVPSHTGGSDPYRCGIGSRQGEGKMEA